MEKVAGGTETILIAEDEPDLRELARIFLEGYGYKVLEAANGEQAIQMADAFGGPIRSAADRCHHAGNERASVGGKDSGQAARKPGSYT